MSTLTVKAVPGRKLPEPRTPGRFVGYTKTKEGFELAGAVEVPNDAYHRRALRRGDLQKVKAAKRSTRKDD